MRRRPLVVRCARGFVRVAVFGLALGATALSAPPPAFAQAPKAQAPKKDAPRAQKPLSQTLTGQAKADFESGKLLANDGDFAGALIKFQAAYDASNDTRLLWNVAFCQKNLRHYSKVVTTLKRYVDEGGPLLSAGDRKDAQELITTLEPFTTRATFHVNEEGAQIFVDDELVGTSPLPAPVTLDIGERHVRVVKPGFQPFERPLAVGGSADVTVEVPLQKEVHEGKLIVDAPAGAEIFIDEKQAGTGKAEQVVPSGGHQLRVTAPGMRPFQTEIVVQDKETRSLNVALEPLGATEKPMLRVAVGCGDTEPRGPEDGLVVYLDGPEVLPPGPVKKRWSGDLDKNVVEHVEYPIPPGRHVIRVSITDCTSREQAVDVDPVKGADVTGALESSRSILVKGPMGSPGGRRVALGLWKAGAGSLKQSTPENYDTMGLSMTGIALDLGLTGRWFGFYVDGAYASGSIHRESFNTNYALPNPGHVTAEMAAMRFGPRFPFNVVSFGFGPAMGIEEVNVDQVRTGKPAGIFGGYFELEIAPLCDWGLYALANANKPTDDDQVYFGTQFGVFFEPNSRCRTERSTPYGLHTNAQEPPP
ncbi:MAG: PEGA domain-containing protein [Polyangiaceae bacterium]